MDLDAVRGDLTRGHPSSPIARPCPHTRPACVCFVSRRSPDSVFHADCSDLSGPGLLRAVAVATACVGTLRTVAAGGFLGGVPRRAAAWLECVRYQTALDVHSGAGRLGS